MHHDVHVLRQPFDARVDDLDRRADLLVGRWREVRLVDLKMPAPGLGELNEIRCSSLPKSAIMRGVSS
jgi:hypothetical protein